MSGASVSNAGQGRLAQVIAARGGKADPEAPFVIEHREALIYMLCEGAELEHGIMCQYLFAAFSLKQRRDEGISEEELAAVTRWRRAIAHVASEEMLHLALVHNLLSAVGAAPHLGRPNLPAPAHHYPAGVNLTLVPFGEPALRHFMFLERPEGMALKGASGIDAPVHEAMPLMAEHDLVPGLQDFATVGHLYRSIEHGLAHLAEKFGEAWLFIGPPQAQASSEHFRWPELVTVTDLASAQRAIDTILEQGEGARGDWEKAHFGQFVQVLDEYRQMKAANPDFDPVRPTMFATVRPCGDAEIPLIADQVTARCTDLFNVAYEVLLQALERYFAHTEETDAQLGTLADASLGLMLRVLKPLGDLITTLPVGPEHLGRTAGPSFELFYESDYLMPHRDAAWMLLEERLRDAVKFCVRLQGKAGEPLATQLKPIAEALGDIADSLAAHFADWGAASRFKSDTPTDDGGDLKALLDQAAAQADLVSGAPMSDEVAVAVRALFQDGHQLLRVAVASGENGPSGGDSRPAGRVAARLLGSVLRPLAEGLTGARIAAKDDAAAHAGTATPDAPHANGGSLDDRVWALAQAATQLCASMPGDHPLADALAEAAACLQQLAIVLAAADGPSGAEVRLGRLREIQAGLGGEIRPSENGPYLVTNVENLRNWLGESIPAYPQMALCRCGASAIKPFCDGTHSQIGFTDEKDPHRVPDRRDTYIGQQVTVLDNRGLCQHSGLCTDRVATAFRVDSEPFVAPSGGRMDEIIRAVRDCPSGALSYALAGVEAREDVDHHDNREPAIEVTKDGPYRVTGAIALRGPRGQEVPRNEGASREHYALCRCGRSQNKPFCSGMHWYVEFTDPVADPDREPTMFEWCGGLPALTRMTRILYEKHVPQDALLAPLFADMAPDHPQRVASWLGETFGGPRSDRGQDGEARGALGETAANGLTEEQRARWVTLICHAADEAGLPSDPEFRSAFNAYIEWQSRLSLEYAQPAARASEPMPTPHWGWTAAGAPGTRASTLQHESEDDRPADLPAAGEPISFQKHIKPLFRERDQKSMKFAFDLWSYDEVKQNAAGILERLRDGSMPCDGAWPAEKIDVFQRWIDLGTPA